MQGYENDGGENRSEMAKGMSMSNKFRAMPVEVEAHRWEKTAITRSTGAGRPRAIWSGISGRRIRTASGSARAAACGCTATAGSIRPRAATTSSAPATGL